MTQKRKQYSNQLKFKVAMEAVKGLATVNEIASQYNVHPNQGRNWKSQLLAEGAGVFERKTGQRRQEQENQESKLYVQIGRLKMELEWLKKKWTKSSKTKRKMIEPRHPKLSIRRQCQLVGLNRATYYRKPKGISELNLKLMKTIDQEYTKRPFYGYRKVTRQLQEKHGYAVNHKRVARLMQKMGLQAVYPRPNNLLQ